MYESDFKPTETDEDWLSYDIPETDYYQLPSRAFENLTLEQFSLTFSLIENNPLFTYTVLIKLASSSPLLMEAPSEIKRCYPVLTSFER